MADTSGRYAVPEHLELHSPELLAERSSLQINSKNALLIQFNLIRQRKDYSVIKVVWNNFKSQSSYLQNVKSSYLQNTFTKQKQISKLSTARNKSLGNLQQK